MQVYLVGGAVRDAQLGIPHSERDWCVVGSTAEELESLGYRRVGKDFPVFLHPETKEEYALARTERKTAPGYHGFEFDCSPAVTIEEDLERRDLTVNALAQDENGRLIDPWGGLDDIENRRLRHVSDAFAEDPVRVLRVARFAARFHHLGFSVAEETMRLMRRMVEDGEVDALVPDRVWKETELALGGRDIRVFIENPEIDTGLHVLMVLDQAEKLSAELDVRFAALVHDLGKGNTPKSKLPSHPGHEVRGCKLIRALTERLPVPNGCRDLGLLVSEYHTHVHRAFELRPGTILKVLENTDAFRRPDRFERFLLTCEADARGRGGLENREYPQAGLLRAAFDAATSIDAGAIADANDRMNIPRAIRRERERAIAAFRASA
jgi:tRNA nucleotidyltransferase (CCA-adding enzyme)